jgi:hypothetical protein
MNEDEHSAIVSFVCFAGVALLIIGLAVFG